MWCIFGSVLLPLGLIAALVYFLYFFFTKVDADLTLCVYDYFGNPKGILSGKVVWITGASSGIGEYLAYELASYKCKLVLSGTNKTRLDNVKANCLGIGLSEDDILVLPFNMSDFDIHEECVVQVLEKFKKVDILVNNAGRSQRAKFEEIEIQVDKEMFDINVFGTLNLTRKLLPHFFEMGEGQYVVTSSCFGKMGSSPSASYTGSKHALHGYFESLRTEMCRKNIHVTIACPGPVFSNILENAFLGKPGEGDCLISPFESPLEISSIAQTLVTRYTGKSQSTTDKRMPTSRCAHLMAVAIAYKLDETWIAMQPCLTLYYLAQYTPSFFRNVVIGKLYTPERATKLREGRW